MINKYGCRNFIFALTLTMGALMTVTTDANAWHGGGGHGGWGHGGGGWAHHGGGWGGHGGWGRAGYGRVGYGGYGGGWGYGGYGGGWGYGSGWGWGPSIVVAPSYYRAATNCRWIPAHRNYRGYWIRAHRACW